MMTVPRHGDLQIDQDPDYQRREWRVQRIGRIALAVIIVAAVVGVFGGGPVSRARTQSADGRLEVRYDRIARHGALTPIRLHVAPRASADSVIAIWLDESYVHGLVMDAISPEPAESRLGDGRLVYHFRLADPSGPADLVIQVVASKLWLRRGAIGLVAGDSVRFRQIVLP